MVSRAPLLRSLQWWWPGAPPLASACVVVLRPARRIEADGFLAALGAQRPIVLLFLDEGPYEGPWPFVSWPSVGVARLLARLAPRRLVMLDDHPRARALAARASCPVTWVNGAEPALLALGEVFVASPMRAQALGGGLVTGDPFVTVPAPPAADADPAFCERFRRVRSARRFIVYFAGTGPGEEVLAYQTFLALSARSAGLLALAPQDPARHESVYRESIKYHLLTIRQRRLLTSEVPANTRVYYIEDAHASRAMGACADALIAGGTLRGGAVDFDLALSAGVPVLVGPVRTDPLVASAVRALAVSACDDDQALVTALQGLIADPAARSERAQTLKDWVALQSRARAQVVERLSDP